MKKVGNVGRVLTLLRKGDGKVKDWKTLADVGHSAPWNETELINSVGIDGLHDGAGSDHGGRGKTIAYNAESGSFPGHCEERGS